MNKEEKVVVEQRWLVCQVDRVSYIGSFHANFMQTESFGKRDSQWRKRLRKIGL